MSVSTTTLPEGYVQSGKVDLKKDKRLVVLLNILALFVFVLVFYLLSIIGTLARSGLTNLSVNISLGMVAILLGLTIGILIIHELIHGFFFWVFSRSRPVFGLRPLYAYAGAPTWFFPKRQYVITALGPLVIIGAVGLLLLLLAPISWTLMIVFLVALNTGGAVGDLFIFSRLLRHSPTSFTNDTGEVVTFFERP